MQLLKIGDILINPEQIASVELQPDLDDYTKVIGHEPNPAACLGGGPTREVYAKLDAVRITMAVDGPFHVFVDAEAEAVRAWVSRDRIGYDLIDLTPNPEAKAEAPAAGPPPAEPSNQWTQTSLGNGWMAYSRATRCDSTTAEMAGAILDARQVAVPDARTEGGDAPKKAAGEAKPVHFREFT